MPIRRVKQYSDRGSIKDLHNGDDDNYPPTDLELRLKQLYEHAVATRDQNLSDSLGFITMNSQSLDPVSVYRHREYVESLKTKLITNEDMTQIVDAMPYVNSALACPPLSLPHIRKAQVNSTYAIHRVEEFVKTADANGNITHRSLRSFRRVS